MWRYRSKSNQKEVQSINQNTWVALRLSSGFFYSCRTLKSRTDFTLSPHSTFLNFSSSLVMGSDHSAWCCCTLYQGECSRNRTVGTVSFPCRESTDELEAIVHRLDHAWAVSGPGYRCHGLEYQNLPIFWAFWYLPRFWEILYFSNLTFPGCYS